MEVRSTEGHLQPTNLSAKAFYLTKTKSFFFLFFIRISILTIYNYYIKKVQEEWIHGAGCLDRDW